MYRSGLLILAALAACSGADLGALPEHIRPDPFGGVVQIDGGGKTSRGITLTSARAAYVSCHLVVSVPEGGAYELAVSAPPGGIAADLFREWFHWVPRQKRYYPDALVPVAHEYRSQMPEPDNRIARQTAQAFWLDLWVPASAAPGKYTITATLRAGGKTVSLPIVIELLAATVPAEDAVTMDHNSYGTSWFANQYPALRKRAGAEFFESDEFFRLIHAYHRIFYEHRGIFHQLGYGHGGKTGPEFAPRLEGSGKMKHVVDWSVYDRHFGPLFDGSAFKSSRLGLRPIPFVYLPVSPEWPASFLWWGEPGYEREFVNVMGEMERHFRERGWTSTRFELFFNHKKRYKAFPWDGDETRFAKDYSFFREYARLMKLAVPADTPVKFVFRSDVSWTMEREFKELADIINFWVCGGGMFGWYLENAPMLKARGDLVWTYGGTPAVTAPLSHVAVEVLRPWLWGVDGFVRWQTTAPGADPWFQFEGGSEAMVYPGDRFGVAGPIASMRLKAERNAVQDVTLLAALAKRHPADVLRAEAARRFNQTTLEEWRAPRPKQADTNPEEWTNADIDDWMPKNPKFTTGLDSAAWQRVREYALGMAKEAK